MYCSVRTAQQNLLPQALAAKSVKAKGKAPNKNLRLGGISSKGATSLVMFTGIMNV